MNMATKINWKASDAAHHLRWRTVGYMKEASVRVMVEGKKRHLRFRVEPDRVISNLHLESKVLFNHLWFEIPLMGTGSVEAFLSKLAVDSSGALYLDDIIYCDEENYNSFEVAYDFDWYEKAYSDADVLTTGDVIQIIKSPNNSGYFIITFENHVTETSKDRVLYHLHRLAKDIVYNHKW